MRGVFCGALLAMAAVGCAGAGNEATAKAAKVALMPVAIKTAKGTYRFRVEVARTPEEQARGLMFRTYIAPNGGMLFPLNPPRVASFWMKNCPIPQDWLFIRADGTIAKIAENTVPYSLESIASDEPVAAVLEIAGGRAAQLGIAMDDTVVWTDKR